MKIPPQHLIRREITRLLEDFLDATAEWEDAEEQDGPDFVAIAGSRFLVEWKASGDAAAVGAGVRRLTSRCLRTASSSGGGKQALPVLAVPFMGDVGRRICSESGVCWLDLSGNACIEAPGIHIRVEGKENHFKRRGRPSSPFAPKSSRIVRWLLIQHGKFHTQRDIASATDMGEGFTSRIVRRLEQLGLIERNGLGEVRAGEPRLLMRAWAEQYDFESHHVIRGHVSARSGEELLHKVATGLSGGGVEYAATGLAGAWLLTHFANYRLATCYVREIPDQKLLDDLGFHPDERGSNLWLAYPKDDGVFQGAQVRDGIHCVHPIQVWLDLKGHQERSAEAASNLEATLLDWDNHAG